MQPPEQPPSEAWHCCTATAPARGKHHDETAANQWHGRYTTALPQLRKSRFSLLDQHDVMLSHRSSARPRSPLSSGTAGGAGCDCSVGELDRVRECVGFVSVFFPRCCPLRRLYPCHTAATALILFSVCSDKGQTPGTQPPVPLQHNTAATAAPYAYAGLPPGLGHTQLTNIRHCACRFPSINDLRDRRTTPTGNVSQLGIGLGNRSGKQATQTNCQATQSQPRQPLSNTDCTMQACGRSTLTT